MNRREVLEHMRLSCQDQADQSKVCSLHFGEELLIECTIRYENEHVVYLAALDRARSAVHWKEKLSHILLAKVCVELQKQGIQWMVLMALDRGSGKLFRFYHEMGFRCIPNGFTIADDIEALEKAPTSEYADFLNGMDESQRAMRNARQCYVMKASVDLLVQRLLGEL